MEPSNDSSIWFNAALLSNSWGQNEHGSSSSSSHAALVLGILFFALVVTEILPRFAYLFLERRGQSHRLCGGIHLGLLLLGALSCWIQAFGADTTESSGGRTLQQRWNLAYDVLLGLSGIATTLTAARDFPHKLVRNRPGQSGSLHKDAVVTQAEMIEHSFYQGLNLAQAVYLHVLFALEETTGGGVPTPRNFGRMPILVIRLACLWLVTAPWLLRHRFPVHGFSQNWSNSPTKDGKSVSSVSTKPKTTKLLVAVNDTRNEMGEILLYRIKKAQYLFYKHVILHGLNISVALGGGGGSHLSIPHGTDWRVFWLLLNASYVMEFFLQTLVKRRVISQARMISLQRLLMVAASLAAANVLLAGPSVVETGTVCLVSLLLNFVHRHHEVVNTMGIALVLGLWEGVK